MIELAPLTAEDSGHLVRWELSASELADWAGSTFTHPLDRGQLEAHLAREAAENLFFRAVDRETGEPVGHVELALGEREARSGTVCRVLVSPARRRAGVGSEMVEALLARAFGELGLDRVELRAFADRPGALRFYERLGFTAEAAARESREPGGGARPMVVMTLTEAAWRARRAEHIAS